MLVKNKNTIKILVITMVNVLLITVAQLSGIRGLILIAMAVYLATMLTSDDETVLPLMLFFLPWSTLLKLSPTAISFYSVATILVFLKYVVRHPRFEKKLVWYTLGIFVFPLHAKILHGYGASASYLMFFLMMVTFPFIYKNIEKKIDFELCIEIFAVGIIVATGISLLCGDHPNMLQYIRIVEDKNLGLTRLCGFYGDPNFYSAQVVTAFGGLLVIIANKKRRLFFDVLLAIFIVVCGMISLSKSFLICVLVVFALWVFAVLFYGPSKLIAIGFVVAVFGAFVLASGTLDSLINQYIIRFGGATDVSSLTTGRTKLWIDYMYFLVGNPIELLFGQGYTSVLNGVPKGSHNTIIQAVYQLGIFGSFLFFSWFGLFKSKEKRINKSNVLFYIVWLVACFSMWMGLDMMFFDDFYINIILFAVGCKYISRPVERQSDSLKRIY